MSNSNTGLQFNFKMGQDLHNVYVPDADREELKDDAMMKLAVMGELAGPIAETAAMLNASAVAAGILKAPSQAAPAASGGGGGGGPVGPTCEHGAKVFKSGTSLKTGNPWKAWDCPQNVCARQFAR